MHPCEARLVEALTHGTDVDAAALGGVEALLAAVDTLAVSPLMGEFILAVSRSTHRSRQMDEFVCRCIRADANDMALAEAVQIIDDASWVGSEWHHDLFTRYLGLCGNRSVSSVARAAMLDGALRLAVASRGRQLRLLAALVESDERDDVRYLAHASRVAGIAFAQWREPELLRVLERLATVDGVRDEAQYELGVVGLLAAIEAEDGEAVVLALESAQRWLTGACDNRERRPDAAAFLTCVRVLRSFHAGAETEQLEALARTLAEAVFELEQWSEWMEAPPWMGARRASLVCLHSLALRLGHLSRHLDQASWWEPKTVVEDCVLACYVASRAILGRSSDGGIEVLARPRIERSLAAREGQAFQLRSWLERYGTNDWATAAAELLTRIDRRAMDAGPDASPREAVTAPPAVAAFTARGGAPAAPAGAAENVIADAQHLHLRNLSAAEIALIEECDGIAASLPDYQRSMAGRQLFRVVLLWTLRFLHSRLELTKGHDPTVAYLFERDVARLPHESELQSDYYRFVYANAPGSDIEASDVSGGRADVRFRLDGERIVTEIKRELDDATFEALTSAYAGQTTEYQNVSVRLGFLLVLDLVHDRTSGCPHITDLVRPTIVRRSDEAGARLVVIVKVPGRRVPPNKVTTEAASLSFDRPAGTERD